MTLDLRTACPRGWIPLLLLAAVAMVGGCASESPRWAKPGATEEQVNRDSQECLTAARSMAPGRDGPRTVINQDRYRQCMANRGYTETPTK
jgi:hypothetical protein